MPEIRLELAVKVAQAKLIAQAVRRIYVQNGGEYLDKQIHHCDAILDASILCRESELARARQGNVLREKGERPHISPSEGRLNSDKLTRYCERREDLLRQARTRVHESIAAFAPQNEGEFHKALEFATDCEDEAPKAQAAPAPDLPAQNLRPLIKDGDELFEMPDVLKIRATLSPEDRKAFSKAFAEHDAATMEKLLKEHPLEVRRAMVKITLAA